MALECSPPHCGDIGDEEPVEEPCPDRLYEQRRMEKIEEAREE